MTVRPILATSSALLASAMLVAAAPRKFTGTFTDSADPKFLRTSSTKGSTPETSLGLKSSHSTKAPSKQSSTQAVCPVPAGTAKTKSYSTASWKEIPSFFTWPKAKSVTLGALPPTSAPPESSLPQDTRITQASSPKELSLIHI